MSIKMHIEYAAANAKPLGGLPVAGSATDGPSAIEMACTTRNASQANRQFLRNYLSPRGNGLFTSEIGAYL